MTAPTQTRLTTTVLNQHGANCGGEVVDMCADCAAKTLAWLRGQPKCTHCGEPARQRGGYCDDCSQEVAEAAADLGVQQTQILVRGGILR